MDHIPSGTLVNSLGLDANNEVVKSSAGSLESSSLTVKFDNFTGYIHGNAGALTGNILFDFTGEIRGATAFMLHNDSSTPTFPSEAKIISGSYIINTDNYIWFCITKTTTGRVVQVTIGQL